MYNYSFYVLQLLKSCSKNTILLLFSTVYYVKKYIHNYMENWLKKA